MQSYCPCSFPKPAFRKAKNWTLGRFACATYSKHFSLGDHQDRLALSRFAFCSQAESSLH
jgi:hypothetical protein